MRSSDCSAKPQKRLTAFEHRILRTLRNCGAVHRRILIAVSGGVDSMALLSVLVRLQPLLKNELAVIHAHHGLGPNVPQKQKTFRNRARQLVSTAADAYGVKCFTVVYRGRVALASEAQFRAFRWRAIFRTQKTWRAQIIATAHNADDLLETRLLRLLRGTGLRGLAAMFVKSSTQERRVIIRPFLQVSRQEILSYAKEMQLSWLEDPSNENLEYRRNWLRHVWLPLLRKAWPSADQTLARSLETIVTEWSQVGSRRRKLSRDIVQNKVMSRPKYLALSREEKSACLADYLVAVGIHDFTQGQIYEISRYLDSSRKRFKFKAVRREWMVTPSEIRVKLQTRGF